MTDAAITAAALTDPDNPPLTDKQLREMRNMAPRAIRERLGLSQAQFASRFGLDTRAVQDWEQGRRRPDRAARSLLRVIDSNPKAVERALRKAG